MRYVSLFSGIEAATHAWHPLGWHCVAVAEIEPFPSHVLAHHYPQTPNLGDVTLLTEDDVKRLGPVDVLVFGSPCQDLSVDGTPVPPKGWGVEGVAIGEQALVEWATLDAQWFGVAQRRRRVFALADFGNWPGRPPVLLEPQGVRGDSAPSRTSGQVVAGCLEASTGGSCVDDARGNRLVPVDTLCVATGQAGAGAEVCRDHSPTLNCNHEVPYVVHAVGEQPCEFCGYPFDVDKLGRYGCPNCEGEGLDVLPFDTTQITSATNRSNPKLGDPCHPLAAGAHAPAIAFDSRQDCVHSFEVFGALGSSSPQAQAVATRWEVRRLTPRECERLQGFRDDFTNVPSAKGKPAADGPRYKALGNSMAVPVMQWIGKSIEFAHLYF